MSLCESGVQVAPVEGLGDEPRDALHEDGVALSALDGAAARGKSDTKVGYQRVGILLNNHICSLQHVLRRPAYIHIYTHTYCILYIHDYAIS